MVPARPYYVDPAPTGSVYVDPGTDGQRLCRSGADRQHLHGSGAGSRRATLPAGYGSTIRTSIRAPVTATIIKASRLGSPSLNIPDAFERIALSRTTASRGDGPPLHLFQSEDAPEMPPSR